jgi:hypothetical protein
VRGAADPPAERRLDAVAAEPLAQQVVRGVGGDAIKPGGERRAGLERCERSERAGEDRLHEVVELGVGAEQAVEVAADLGLVAVVELAQRPAIAGPRA